MRLKILLDGHSPTERERLQAVTAVRGGRTPDVESVFHYRHDWFGDAYTRLLQEIMRGPSVWSVGERELFAAFVSKTNSCLY